MLVIREATPDHLVVGIERKVEFLGLIFCGIGLLTLTMFAISQFEHLEWSVSPVLLIMASGYFLLPFGCAGIFMVFTQRRFIFYKPHEQVFYKQGMFKDVMSKFGEYRKVELIETSVRNSVVNLITMDGRRIVVTRGPLEKVGAIAERIADYTGWPIEHNKDGRTWLSRLPPGPEAESPPAALPVPPIAECRPEE